MRLYKCGNCGHVMERDEVDWRREKYDEPTFDEYPFCPRCGSDDIEFGQSCEYCEADIAESWLGSFQVCQKCKELILTDIEKNIDGFAQDRAIDYKTAKEWFLGWAEERW